MTEELLPCPFCGGIAGFDLDDGLIFVRCLDCGIQGKSFAYDWERDDVMKAREEVREVVGKYWNTRAQPKYKRVDLDLKREMRNPVKQGGKSNDWYQNGYDVGYNAAIDDIKSKYGDLYVEVK